jgi:hypothetical protein
MATFVTSNISAAMVSNFFAPAAALSWSADTINAALYGTTPDSALAKNDTFAHNAYLAVGGQWVTANESTGTGYTAGGTALGTKTNTFGSGTQQVSAANPSWTTATLANVFGCLVYDVTLASKAVFCWNYFGGAQSVTAGTFTIVWSGSGIMQFTIT